MRIDVDFYNEKEEQAFSGHPRAGRFQKMVRDGLTIDPLEFLANSMFMEQKLNPGWSTRDELRARAAGRIEEFDEYFDSTDTLRARFPAADMEYRTERAGVAAALSAMDSVFDTHSADWEKIPVSGEKDLDFRVAAVGDGLVTVEAKASIVADPAKKEPGISKHKKSIKDKKAAQDGNRAQERLLGTIVAIPTSHSESARIWLVDPPIDDLDIEPAKHRVLTRLRYYYRVISTIGTPHMLIALSNRIRVLESVSDWSSLDGVPLVSGQGKGFGVPISFSTGIGDMRGHTHGFVMRRKEKLVYVGIDLDAVVMVGKQSFAQVATWESRLSGKEKRDIWVDWDTIGGLGQFETEHIVGAGPSGRQFRFTTFTNRAGTTYGEIPIREKV